MFDIISIIFILMVGFFVICFLCFLGFLFFRRRGDIRIRRAADTTTEMTPDEFFRFRNHLLKSKSVRKVPGVYILFNKTQNMHYVGQSVDVLNRVNAHLTGKGNGDVYADYKYGNEFTIRIIKLANSGFKTLNELERHAIKTYNAYSRGYNKTRGNKD